MSFTLLILLIVLVSVFLILRTIKPNNMTKSNTKKPSFRISKTGQFKILLGFLGLLLLLTAIGEFVAAGKQTVDPPPLADANIERLYDSIHDQIFNRVEVDPRLLV